MLGTLAFICAFIPVSLSYNKTLYAAVEAETRLLNDLLEEYDVRARPVTKVHETIHASFGLSFQSLLGLHETGEYMESTSYMLTAWHDGRLSWNKSNYMGIDAINIPEDDIWRPDFVSYTTVDEKMHFGKATAKIYASGHVHWNPRLYLRSPCTVNLRKFPFDKQTCSMVFASGIHHGRELNMTYMGGQPDTALDVSDYKDTEWHLGKHSLVINVIKSVCCKELYPHMKITFEFTRNPDFLVHMFVLPALLLAALVPFTLLMPPDSKERVTIGSIVILTILLLQAKLCDILPMGHTELPAISVYYSLTLLWTIMSLICSIFVLNLHNRGAKISRVPDSVRWLFLRSLRRLVCLGSENYYPLSETEVINMRGLEKTTHAQDRLSNAGQTPDTRVGPATSKLEKDMDEMTRQMVLLCNRFSRQDNHQDIVDEWRQVALVVDRILFLLFIVVFFIGTVFLLA